MKGLITILILLLSTTTIGQTRIPKELKKEIKPFFKMCAMAFEAKDSIWLSNHTTAAVYQQFQDLTDNFTSESRTAFWAKNFRRKPAYYKQYRDGGHKIGLGFPLETIGPPGGTLIINFLNQRWIITKLRLGK